MHEIFMSASVAQLVEHLLGVQGLPYFTPSDYVIPKMYTNGTCCSALKQIEMASYLKKQDT